MVTIIFIGEDGGVINIRFSRNDDLNTSHRYGKWNLDTNEIELNDNGWRVFETYRKEIRKLKPLLEMLEKSAKSFSVSVGSVFLATVLLSYS